ncbi:MAG: PKD domain-containing protein [Marinirhabdus sp.]
MNNHNKKRSVKSICVCFVSLFLITTVACDYEFDLPEAGSKVDETPPTANFDGAPTDGDFLTYNFANLSSSATTYFWEFGDGNTSTEIDPSNTYPSEGTYTVTLTASDAHAATSTTSKTIEIVEPLALLPTILEAGFEDNSLPDGTGDGRDSWRNSDLGGVIQITSSPVQQGSQAAKFPKDGDRIGYQELQVSPNSDYLLSYYYTLKSNDPGSVTVWVLDGPISDLADVGDATIAFFEGTDQSDPSTYAFVNLPFNSGENSIISILITNEGEEARVDNFSIALN